MLALSISSLEPASGGWMSENESCVLTGIEVFEFYVRLGMISIVKSVFSFHELHCSNHARNSMRTS